MRIDFGMSVKVYGRTQDEATRRYSPAECIGCEKEAISGNPDRETNLNQLRERKNLTMRNVDAPLYSPDKGFSKKIENHSVEVLIDDK